MKKITLLFALLLSMQALVAQDWIWEKKFESTGSLNILDIAAGYAFANGDYVYVVGSYTGTITLGSNSISSASGSQDAFIAQLDMSGNINWITDFGSWGDDEAAGISCDLAGNVYVTGYYTLKTDSPPVYHAQFPNSILTPTYATTPTPIKVNSGVYTSGARIPYIVKFSRTGLVQWANIIEAEYGGGTATALAPSNDGSGGSMGIAGDLYVTGYFYEDLSYPGSGSNPNIHTPGISATVTAKTFVAHYATNTGNIIWANYVDNNMAAGSESYGMELAVEDDNVSLDGDVYLVGYYKGEFDMDYTQSMTTMSLSTSTSYSGYIAKLDHADGDWMWVHDIASNGDDFAASISTYPDDGDLYITGSFAGKNTLAFRGSSITKTGIGGSDIYVAKYNNSGVCQWAEVYGGRDNDHGTDIDAFNDDVATLYISGLYQNNATFGNKSLTATGSGTGTQTDHYLGKIDRSNGYVTWVESIDGNDNGYGSLNGLFSGPKIAYERTDPDPIFMSGMFKSFESPTFVNTLTTSSTKAGYVAAHRDCSCPTAQNVQVVYDIFHTNAVVSWDVPDFQYCINDYFVLYTEQGVPPMQQADGPYAWGTGGSNPIATTTNPYEWIVVTDCSPSQTTSNPIYAKTGTDKTSKTQSKVVVTKGINSSSNITAYPNPVSNRLTISTDFIEKNQGINALEVTNVLGQTVKKMSFSSAIKNFDLPLDGLENGVYTITVTSGADQHTFKIVKE